MRVWFKQFVSPPIFDDDPGKTAVAKTLHAITLFLFVALVFLTSALIVLAGRFPTHLWLTCG